MEIQTLIDPKNERLYAGIKEYFKIQLVENQDWRASAWGSSIEGDTAIIKYCPTDFPQACFAHELLHIDAQTKGFREVSSGTSLNKETQQFLPTIIKYLNITFQHHKIAKPFLLMGYPSEQFYDAEEYPMVDHLLNELEKEGHSRLYLILLYLDFIAPLTGITEDQKQALQIAFGKYSGGKFKQTFFRIDEIIQHWINDDGYIAEAYFIDFLSTAGIKDTWLSYEKNALDNIEHHFPKSGFFIGNSFTTLDIEKKKDE